MVIRRYQSIMLLCCLVFAIVGCGPAVSSPQPLEDASPVVDPAPVKVDDTAPPAVGQFTSPVVKFVAAPADTNPRAVIATKLDELLVIRQKFTHRWDSVYLPAFRDVFSEKHREVHKKDPAEPFMEAVLLDLYTLAESKNQAHGDAWEEQFLDHLHIFMYEYADNFVSQQPVAADTSEVGEVTKLLIRKHLGF